MITVNLLGKIKALILQKKISSNGLFYKVNAKKILNSLSLQMIVYHRSI